MILVNARVPIRPEHRDATIACLTEVVLAVRAHAAEAPEIVAHDVSSSGPLPL